ncbi:MAG TPA: hypothetical protein EYP80_00190 [Candidatus Aenigmarchaeota archaeon]|nr:hypothetical protein [Candidatus Aenigmarchaeota archaeon]
MSKKIFEDNLAYPKDSEAIKFQGKEPFKIYDKIKDFLKENLEISGKDIFERILKWDATDINKSFYVKIEAVRKLDSWSEINLIVVARGSQNSQTKEGDVTIALKPFFRTIVSGNFLQINFWWIYYFVYYKKKREQYFYMAKTMINKLKKDIGNLYNIKLEESV